MRPTSESLPVLPIFIKNAKDEEARLRLHLRLRAILALSKFDHALLIKKELAQKRKQWLAPSFIPEESPEIPKDQLRLVYFYRLIASLLENGEADLFLEARHTQKDHGSFDAELFNEVAKAIWIICFGEDEGTPENFYDPSHPFRFITWAGVLAAVTSAVRSSLQKAFRRRPGFAHNFE